MPRTAACNNDSDCASDLDRPKCSPKGYCVSYPTYLLHLSNEWPQQPDFWNNYQPVVLLGKGAFGEVWKIINKKTGEKYALKVLQQIDPQTTNEVDILMEISNYPQCHPNIVCYYDKVQVPWPAKAPYNPIGGILRSPLEFTLKKKQLSNKIKYIPGLIMELVDGPTLFDVVADYGPIPPQTVAFQFKSALHGLTYIHENGIAHRDLKPENLMVRNNDPTNTILIDFGLSCQLKDGCYKLPGSVPYMAPEIIAAARKVSDLPYDVWEKADLWSLGATFYAILTGLMPEWMQETPKGKIYFNKVEFRKSMENLAPDPDDSEGMANLKLGLLSLLDPIPERRENAQRYFFI